jgi:hypothetical protein
MPTSAQVTVTTSATLLVAASTFDQTVWLHNSGGALYIGGSNVTTANGYKLDTDDKMELPVGDNEGLYGIVASGTNTVFVLKQIN